MFEQEGFEDFIIDHLNEKVTGFKQIKSMDGMQVVLDKLGSQVGIMPACLVAVGKEDYEDKSNTGMTQRLQAEFQVFIIGKDVSRERAKKADVRELCRLVKQQLRGMTFKTNTTTSTLRLRSQDLILAEHGILCYQQIYRFIILDTNEST